jgi:molybdopterin molybdotransferase
MNAKPDECAGPDHWSIKSAFEAIVSAPRIAGEGLIRISGAIGRVAAADVVTRTALPRFDQSAMDGYGIHAADLTGDGIGPLRLTGLVRAGGDTLPLRCGSLRPGETVRLMTGASIPEDVAAVVMEERVDVIDGMVIPRVVPDEGENIRRRGEDVAEGSVIVRCGQRLDARHVALLAASGHAEVMVVRRIRVGVLSCGDELVDPGETVNDRAVFDSNRPMVMALLSTPATEVVDLGRVPDEPARYATVLGEAHADFDLIITSGGVSGSDADHTVEAVRKAGGTSTRISLAVKPGKPFAFGAIGPARIVSLPGNPVAAMVGTLLFVRPLLERLAGSTPSLPEGLVARTTSPFFHRSGRTEFVPAAVTGRSREGHLLVEKLGKGGSARLAPLVAADGFAVIPAEVGDVGAGDPVTFHPFRTNFAL